MAPLATFLTTEEYLTAVEQMRPSLVETARQNCYLPDDAEDVVQEVIMYCLRELSTYDPAKASLKTWVTGKVICEAIGSSRAPMRRYKQLVQEYTGFPDDVEHTEDTHRAQMKPRPPQEQGYEPDYDLKISVQQALAKLPEDERKAATAVFLEGYTEGEYAEQAGVTDRTVRRWLKSAREQLRVTLKEYDL